MGLFYGLFVEKFVNLSPIFRFQRHLYKRNSILIIIN